MTWDEFEKEQEEQAKTLRGKFDNHIYYPLWRAANRVRSIPGNIHDFYQRGKRGYADNDAWGVDNYLSSFVPELLRHMIDKEHGGGNSYPPGTTYKKWHQIVKKIADGFEASRLQDDLAFNTREQFNKDWDNLEKKRKEGMTLFTEWYNHLWD